MNKEIEKAKEDLSFINEGDYITREMSNSKDILIKYIQHLEQKESILDKVTDKLKEIRRELDDDGFDYYAQEITEALNITEAEKK